MHLIENSSMLSSIFWIQGNQNRCTFSGPSLCLEQLRTATCRKFHQPAVRKVKKKTAYKSLLFWIFGFCRQAPR